MRRLLTVVLLVALSSLLVALAYVRRDPSPLLLQLQLPQAEATFPTEIPIQISLEASRVARWQLRYGDSVYEAQGRSVNLEVEPLAGERWLEIEAYDRSGQRSSLRQAIFGVPRIQPMLAMPREVQAGEALSIQVAWPPLGIPVEHIAMQLGGQPLQVFPKDNDAVALASAPLDSGDSELLLELHITDGFGRVTELQRPVRIHDHRRPVQDLNVPEAILQVANADNQQREAALLQGAYASVHYRVTPRWREPFLLPIQGRQSSGFGIPRRYRVGGPISYHQGADIAAPSGTPIAASNDGRVIVAGFYPIRGGLVVIDHGAGVSSHYFHQSQLYVAVGDEVMRGDIIGDVGSTGLSTGPHLHWEMRVNDTPTDPLRWVDRMLP